MLLSKYYTCFKNCYSKFFYISVSGKSILSLTFAVKYFNQKTSDDALMKHFNPGNTGDQMNAFD